MKLSRRSFLAGTAAVGLVGVRPAAAQTQPQKGGQIIVGISQEPQNFNPLMPTIESQRGVHMAIFDDLWRIDGKGNFVPDLAVAMPTQANGGISKDGTLFTVDAKKHVVSVTRRPTMRETTQASRRMPILRERDDR